MLSGTRRAFTVLETIMAITVAGAAAAMAIPQVASTVSHARVNQAAITAQAALEQAASLAARVRKPIRFTVDANSVSLVMTDRASQAQVAKYTYGLTSESHLTTISCSPSQIDFYPNGTLSQPLTLTLGVAGYTRTVTMSRAGQVRLVSP